MIAPAAKWANVRCNEQREAGVADTLTEPATARERVKTLAGLIGEEALAGEQLGRLTDHVADAMLGADLFSVLLPERYGGLGEGRAAYFEVVEEIARADGSAGWVASVCNAVNYAAFKGLPEEGRRELFGHGPVACWAALPPVASSQPRPGGYLVSTKGVFGSGSSVSRWVLVASPGSEAQGPAQFRAHYVPKHEVRIEEAAWDVMGLRGTASIDYAVDEVFVPTHRTYEYGYATGPAGGTTAVELMQLNALGLAAFASGVAQHALNELLDLARKTKRVAGQGMQAEDNVVQFGVGEIEGRMRAARTHVLSIAEKMDEAAASGRPFSGGLDAMQANQTLARASRDMVIFAFDNASAAAIYARHPLQRCLRDIFTGLKHASFTPALLGRIGKVRLGLDFGGPAF
jgi:alkylation response protein AidB-like acyl-CoA dehydrogenase